jgi:hypothetical protein
MGADYSFYVIFIATYAPMFLGYNNSVLAIVSSYQRRSRLRLPQKDLKFKNGPPGLSKLIIFGLGHCTECRAGGSGGDAGVAFGGLILFMVCF